MAGLGWDRPAAAVITAVGMDDASKVEMVGGN